MSKKNRQKGKDKRLKGQPRVQPIVVENTYFGTEFAGGDRAISREERRNRCFELAGHAVVFGSVPEGSLLVHGSWHGPAEDMVRIAHAWVQLPDGWVWEPISCNVYKQEEFEHWAAAWSERSYSKAHAKALMNSSGHYGAWHVNRYESNGPEDEPCPCGKKNDLLHNEAGVLRGTAPNADGKTLDRFDRNIRKHREMIMTVKSLS